jgi:hypothetical protein
MEEIKFILQTISVMIRKIIILVIFISGDLISQSGPWNNPLRIASSLNGTTFSSSQIYQDSAGVPCVIKWKGDTLICVFQWFRQPIGSPTWDKVAVKFSYNNGVNWTPPQPVTFIGMPSGFQRPFDPTIVTFSGDSIRMYFSSSESVPPGDSGICTYSAKSKNGITYYFEPWSRVKVIGRSVIDPAVTYFNGLWRYTAPVGAPHEGAYYYTSADGLNFTFIGIIPSDNMHNWTGNLMLENSSEMRFYGSGINLWYNRTTNGTNWLGYINTNLTGGDPSVLKISENNYIAIYVGLPYTTGIENNTNYTDFKIVGVFPNPFNSSAVIKFYMEISGNIKINIYDIRGRFITKIKDENMSKGYYELHYTFNENVPSGIYICQFKSLNNIDYFKMIYIK